MQNDLVTDFYDGLAEDFHLVHADWHASVLRQGAQLAAILRERWPGAQRVLDAACGIGTQALGLAGLGFDVVGSDLALSALNRARREAAARDLAIEFLPADLRSLSAVHRPPFDVVLACDNSVPHLQTEGEILQSFREMHSLLRAGGGCLLSVRDYDTFDRSGSNMLSFGVRRTPSGRVAVFQVWDFIDADHYDLGMFFVHELDGAPRTRVFRTRYFAVGLSTLENLLREAGFAAVERLVDRYYQPVLVATKPA